ncbi:MAG: HAD family hydrolase [Candidatus Tumulicola sp.]
MSRAGAATGVGFDIDHTIVIDNKLERVAFLRLLETIVNDGGRVPENLNDEIARIDALLDAQRRNAFTIDEAVRRFAEACGVAPRDSYVEQFRTMAVAMVADFVIPLPGARAAFADLRGRGVATAILSNGWNPLQVEKARRAGFDGPVLVSAELGVQKPDRRAFDVLLDALGTDAGRTWYVGDDPHCDVEGARDAGLRAIWLDAEGRGYPAGAAAPACTIHSLAEIAGCISTR